jgi:hypothetical protein
MCRPQSWIILLKPAQIALVGAAEGADIDVEEFEHDFPQSSIVRMFTDVCCCSN